MIRDCSKKKGEKTMENIETMSGVSWAKRTIGGWLTSVKERELPEVIHTCSLPGSSQWLSYGVQFNG